MSFSPTQRALFPEAVQPSALGLESRRYIGSKAKLADWILSTIGTEVADAHSFFDVFAGTASVSKAALKKFSKVIINDHLYANNVIHKAFFATGIWDNAKIITLLENYNGIDPKKLDENYFSVNFGGKFFDHDSAKLIGHIRDDIEKRKATLSDKEYNILLATLIYNIDRIANTVGHFDAYIKKPIRQRPLQFVPIRTSAIANVEIYRQDANALARKVPADVAYLDPPYNSRQYNRFYHLYETLVKWNKPPLFGVALKPEPENSSLYCTVKAKDSFADLIDHLQVKYVVVSYNNTYNSKSSSSENKIRLDEIDKILNSRGTTKIYQRPYRAFNTGKTEFDNHKEYLFLTKIAGK